MYQVLESNSESELKMSDVIKKKKWGYTICITSTRCVNAVLVVTMIWIKGPKRGGPCLDYLHHDLVSLQCEHILLCSKCVD